MFHYILCILKTLFWQVCMDFSRLPGRSIYGSKPSLNHLKETDVCLAVYFVCMCLCVCMHTACAHGCTCVPDLEVNHQYNFRNAVLQAKPWAFLPATTPGCLVSPGQKNSYLSCTSLLCTAVKSPGVTSFPRWLAGSMDSLFLGLISQPCH